MKYKGTDITIRNVQLVQLEILLEFDRICKSNNIPYQLFAGTLLGAVRHKGFIPWDDDIDVCLLRQDYERFIKCCTEDLDKKYFLQDYRTDKNAVLQFAKIRKNNTIFINSVERDSGMHSGIFIDIFPLDNVTPNTLKGKLQPWLFNGIYIISSSRLKSRATHARTAFNRCGRLMFHYITKLIPKRFLDECMQKTLRMYQDKNVIFVNHLTNGVSKERLKKYLRDKKQFYDIEYMEFEGHPFPVPQNYDEVLKNNFGDYMALPPASDQYPHHGIVEVNFDTTQTRSS